MMVYLHVCKEQFNFAQHKSGFLFTALQVSQNFSFRFKEANFSDQTDKYW